MTCASRTLSNIPMTESICRHRFPSRESRSTWAWARARSPVRVHSDPVGSVGLSRRAEDLREVEREEQVGAALELVRGEMAPATQELEKGVEVGARS